MKKRELLTQRTTKRKIIEPKHIKESKMSDFMSANEVKGNKMTFSDNDDDDDDDVDIDIRDEEDEMKGNIDKREVEDFIKKLGLDKFGDDGFEGDEEDEGSVEDQDESRTRNLNSTSKVEAIIDEKKNTRKSSKHEHFHSVKQVAISTEKSKEEMPRKQKRKLSKKNKFDKPVQNNEISSSSQRSSRCTIQLTGKWFEVKITRDSNVKEAADDSTVSTFVDIAKELYEKEGSIYEQECLKQEKGHTEWMKTVVTSGVLADKVAALGLQIQEAPVHTLQYVDQLLTMGKKKGRREAVLAMNALRHLFLEELLPNDRKLQRFEKHDFDKVTDLPIEVSNRHLIFWYFEDQLKKRYENFVNIQQTLSLDLVTEVKLKAISTMYELLVNKPELEQQLLAQMVNKLGDPNYKIATRVVHWFKNLVKVHPSMKVVIITEVEKFLYGPNVTSKTQYYCICFFNQLLLSRQEADLATKLITIYFKYFNMTMTSKKLTDTSHKMLSALLTGVNRAYPFAKVDDESVNEQMDLLFKVAQQSKFSTGLQALMLLKQVSDSRHSMTDRFYSALYRKLLDNGLTNSPRQAMFLNLVFQAAKNDIDEKRVRAFIKRTLQICHSQNTPFICGALFMVSEVLKSHPNLKIFQHFEEESDDEEEHFEDLKADDDDDSKDEEKQITKGGTSSWIHKAVERKSKAQEYDAFARNPSFSGAEKSILWELNQLVVHFHPSVSQFAESILSGNSISYDGNPLDDFTLMKFLNRFAFKNPKSSENTATTPLEKKVMQSSTNDLVNRSKILSLQKGNIPLDVEFFHKYFSQKKELANLRKEQAAERTQEKDGDDDSDADSQASSVRDDEFDDFIDEELEKVMEKVDSDDDVVESGEDSDEDERIIDDFEDFKKKGLDENLDFARDLSTKKAKKVHESGSSSEDEMSEEEGVFDDEEAGNEKEFEVLNEEEYDEEGFGQSDNEDLEEPPQPKKVKMTKPEKKGKEKKKPANKTEEDKELLHNAEQFSSMIDETVGAKFDNMTMEALSNKDKAHQKQLRWEMERDKWIRGRDTKSIIAAKKRDKRHRWFSKKKGRGGKTK